MGYCVGLFSCIGTTLIHAILSNESLLERIRVGLRMLGPSHTWLKIKKNTTIARWPFWKLELGLPGDSGPHVSTLFVQGEGLHSGPHCQLHSVSSGHSHVHLCASYFPAYWEASLPFSSSLWWSLPLCFIVESQGERTDWFYGKALTVTKSGLTVLVGCGRKCTTVRRRSGAPSCMPDVPQLALSPRFQCVHSTQFQLLVGPMASFPLGEAGFSAPEPIFQWIPKAMRCRM